MPPTAACAILSGSWSGKAMNGFLPPSSSVTFLMPLSAAALRMARPVGTEPVNAMRFTLGWRTSASPVGMPLPVTMLATPGGRTSLQISPSTLADSGLVSGGFTTTVLPAIKGAASAFEANLIGWLNGTMRPTTP